MWWKGSSRVAAGNVFDLIRRRSRSRSPGDWRGKNDGLRSWLRELGIRFLASLFYAPDGQHQMLSGDAGFFGNQSFWFISVELGAPSSHLAVNHIAITFFVEDW